jgi:hypothetical protein
VSQRLPQPLHIFRKDVLHLWPEILVSCAVLAGFAWANIIVAGAPPAEGLDPATVIAWLLRLLTPVAWLVLLSRLIHDEELVGDRQFWITRPYTWPSLLASKALFVVLFILLPFAIMQAVLLHHAHLYPTLSLKGMGFSLLTFTILTILPLFAIAAVTINFIRYILFSLAALLYAIAAIGIGFWLFPDHFAAPFVEYLLGGLFVLLPLVAIFLAYARREITAARILLAATPIVIILAAALAPVGALVHARYPDNSFGSVVFDTSSANQQPTGRLFVFRGKVDLHLPVQPTLSGDPGKNYATVQYTDLDLTGPNGFHFNTGWQPALPPTFLAGGQPSIVGVTLPQSVYDRIHNTPVTAHLDLAIQAFQPGTPYTVTATEKPFPIPGHANCTVSPHDGSLNCNYPYEHQYGAQVQATVHPGDCLTPGPQSAIAEGLLRNTSSLFDPVATTTTRIGINQHPFPVCPNTPITLIPTDPHGYGRFHLDIPNLNVDTYALRLPVRDPNAQQP